MQSWYYWYQSLPANVNPAAYATPDALLDALRQQPLDRFSFIITQAASQAFFGAGQYVGYGFGIAPESNNTLRVTRVFPGSPAAGAGLARGDEITAVNGVAVTTLIAENRLGAALAADAPGVVMALTWTDLRRVVHQATLTSAVVTQPSVAQAAVLTSGRAKVGYIQFDSFIDPSNAELDQAFGQFLGEGVTQLVIDERYNGGGEVSVAQHLASLIAGNGISGMPLSTLTYNDRHTDRNQTLPFASVSNALDLKQVLFITSHATASASELVINALRPYLDVVLVGSRTYGKPVGSNGFNVCSNVLYPITFEVKNAVGYGDYFDGLPVTCAASDDLSHPLGDAREASLATALGYVRTGACGTRAEAAAQEEARREAAHPREERRYEWRDVIGAY
jgi:C-terminal processing protease CtpA/Prc